VAGDAGLELGAGIAQPGEVADGSAAVDDDEGVGAPGEGEAAGGAEAGEDEAAGKGDGAAEVEASPAAVPVDAGWVRSLKQ
jgi:hypothetical protein